MTAKTVENIPVPIYQTHICHIYFNTDDQLSHKWPISSDLLNLESATYSLNRNTIKYFLTLASGTIVDGTTYDELPPERASWCCTITWRSLWWGRSGQNNKTRNVNLKIRLWSNCWPNSLIGLWYWIISISKTFLPCYLTRMSWVSFQIQVILFLVYIHIWVSSAP